MSPPIDPSILRALGLNPNDPSSFSASLSSHGGSSFSSTSKLSISSPASGSQKTYFLKTATGPSSSSIMFTGEHASLNAINSLIPSFCPRSHGTGSLSSNADKHFLVTDFLDLRASSSSSSSGKGGSGESFAQKLAKMHTTPAPIPEGYDKPMFGFPVTTYCGATEQDNSWKERWGEFYADNRLRHVLREGEKKNGEDKELAEAVEKTAARVVPRLLGEETIGKVTPVLIHGDLWSGNQGRGRFSGEEWGGGVEEVVYDPASVYGHSEYELGIMKMFGGFGPAFWKEYGELVPKQEPKEEWEDRVALYELYHHLNHYALFGGGYRGGAMSIMKKLIAKYA
ncbi:Fructosamine/Ketosamine-3-kinase [Sordaria brevicollis]|uniref:protein-ribulosamine 3-kinase n=1 Tax=Sordaria brevicollis TaxID=83679 RepID=A0AAE0P2Q5_SORBR|nr:Fructosamine/Ketosamine-3-kinase [Sordaria brevicollis]